MCFGEIKKKAKERAALIAHKTVCLGDFKYRIYKLW
jgi:hypothetical protein